MFQPSFPLFTPVVLWKSFLISPNILASFGRNGDRQEGLRWSWGNLVIYLDYIRWLLFFDALTAANPWAIEIWTLCVSTYTDFFSSKYCWFYNVCLVESLDAEPQWRNCVYRRPVISCMLIFDYRNCWHPNPLIIQVSTLHPFSKTLPIFHFQDPKSF